MGKEVFRSPLVPALKKEFTADGRVAELVRRTGLCAHKARLRQVPQSAVQVRVLPCPDAVLLKEETE